MSCIILSRLKLLILLPYFSMTYVSFHLRMYIIILSIIHFDKNRSVLNKIFVIKLYALLTWRDPELEILECDDENRSKD